MDEGNAGQVPLVFRVSMPQPLEVPVTFDYSAESVTAISGEDFIAAQGQATIPAGETGVGITVMIRSDTDFEADESIQLRLTGSVNASLGVTVLNGTIRNDDAQPGLTVEDAVVTTAPQQGSFQAWIPVRLDAGNAPLPVPVSWTVSTRDGTALAGEDYEAVNEAVLTLPANHPAGESLWIAITVPAHSLHETVRHFSVDFTSRSGPVVSASAEVRIERLRITEFQALGEGLYSVSFPTGIAQNYVIEQAPSPAGPWQNKTSVISGTGTPVDELLLFSSLPRAYFRVRVFHSPPVSPVILTP